MNGRLKLLSILFLAAWCGLSYRLFYIQIYKGNEYSESGKRQYLSEVKIDSYRGDIRDRNGKKLAIDLAYYTYEAYPRHVEDKWKVATIFGKHFGKTRDYYLNIMKKNKNFVYLERKVPYSIAKKLENSELVGVQRYANYNRSYKHGNITGHILGFTDIDNNGIDGLEFSLNSILAGTAGKMIVTKDAKRNRKTDYSYPIMQPVNGKHVVTTIDIDYQKIAVEELEKAVKEFKAKSGSVILMNPRTGEVLSMVSLPLFDNNKFAKSQPDVRRNRVITDSFEPGSIFKIVTAAAALDLKRVDPGDSIFCENGVLKEGRKYFHDSIPHGMLSFQEVIELSSNIGTYKAAQEVGAKNIYKYALKFGFGKKTGIRFGGETAGLIREPKKWSATSLRSIAIGQEVSVNALQIINAYAAVANGGILMKPHIVKSILDESGKIVEEFGPEKIRRVVSKKTAETLNEFFKGVVEKGTGTRGKMEMGIMAGKTGTAEKVDPATKTYSKTDYISSFVGYYPADDPKIVGIVIIDSPRGNHYGGYVAAPALREIFRRITHLPRNTLLNSTFLASENKVETPGFWDKVKSILSGGTGKGREVKTKAVLPGANDFTVSNDTAVSKNSTVKIEIAQNTKKNPKDVKPADVLVPDIRGLPLRDAIRKLTSSGLDFEISGTGIVITQTPKPGQKVPNGTVTKIFAQDPEEYKN